MACYISPKWYFKDEVSETEVKNEVFGDVGMELMDYEKD